MYIVLTSGIFWEEGQLGRTGEKESGRGRGMETYLCSGGREGTTGIGEGRLSGSSERRDGLRL